ncbi:MAG: hypothetical protein WD768_09275 [Phycisphaeraceae bacterium]
MANATARRAWVKGGRVGQRPAQRRASPSLSAPDAGVSYEVDPDYLEQARREALADLVHPVLPRDA